MPLPLAFMLMLAQPAAETPAPAAETEAESDVITVTATRRKCRVSIANRILSDREFRARAEEWARGRPLTVVSPRGADYRCLARIMFRLNDKGVRLVRWVDETGADLGPMR